MSRINDKYLSVAEKYKQGDTISAEDEKVLRTIVDEYAKYVKEGKTNESQKANLTPEARARIDSLIQEYGKKDLKVILIKLNVRKLKIR